MRLYDNKDGPRAQEHETPGPTDGDENTPVHHRFDWFRRHKRFVIPATVMVLLLPLLGLLALRRHHARAEYTSPGVFPSRELCRESLLSVPYSRSVAQGYGAGNWSQAYEKAQRLVSQMTLSEMNNITIGVSSSTGCVGVSGSAPRVGFPGLCLHDAGNGVRGVDGVNAYASGITVGASWNASLAYERAQFMGAEFKRKGVHVALGPVVGPLGRIATDGRAWEGFGADPYLNGILGAQTVRGMQESVIACVKHFIGNEQETNRNPISAKGSTVLSTSSNVDDQTIHELYAFPFHELIYAGAGSIMCSYNRINNTYACENSKTMNGVLKGEMNFQGFVVSDWVAQHSGLPSALAGLDMAMPGSSYWDNDQLVSAVHDNTLNQTRLEDMATRIIATWYHFGLNDSSWPELGIGMAPDITKSHQYIDAKDPKSRPNILQQALEGHVLVKNVNNALPLQTPKVMSVFGYDSVSQTSLDPDAGSGQFKQNWEFIGLDQQQISQIGSNMPLSEAPQSFAGMLLVGGGSGSNTPAYISSPLDAITTRAYDDGTAIFSDSTSLEPQVVSSSDVCLVAINEYASEAWDRPGLADPSSDALVSHVASRCNNTVVVIHNAGIRLVDAWIENDNVTAVIFAHLPGQDAGRALAALLYGDASPSGRLPYTVARSSSDYGPLEKACQASDSPDSFSPQCDFTEGSNIDYRRFLAQNITPRYEFGYGLTYTSFEYADLSVQTNATATPANTTVAPVYANGTTNGNRNVPSMGVAGPDELFAVVGHVTATVSNVGHVDGAEVAQLYLTIPTSGDEPVRTKVLRGFQKRLIAAGQSATIEFDLRLKDISVWDVVRQAWVVPKGEFRVDVGKSVLDTPLTGTFTT